MGGGGQQTHQRHDGAALCMQIQVRQQEDDVEYRVLARSEAAAPADDGAVLRDYFNAGTSLGELAQTWADKDTRFCSVHPYFPGAHQYAIDTCPSSQCSFTGKHKPSTDRHSVLGCIMRF